MLFKLSMSGLKSKFKDYAVLLTGLVMSISIFYLFQTLALNRAFIEANSVIRHIQFVFHAGSFLLAVITFFYILYANSFLLSLRQKEFGMYMTLGAKKHKIASLMFMETMVIGMASLVLGIALGTGLSQGIGQLLMKQLDFTAGGYYALYVPSIAVTCIFFFVLFMLSAIWNSIKLSRVTVLQLVHSDKQTDRVRVKGKMTGFIAVLAMILLTIGYAAMIKMEVLRESGIIIALIATTAGTYLLFMSLLPLLIKKLKSNKNRNEKGLNAFTFAQLNFRINSLSRVLATVAMLVALGAGAISAGMAFKNNAGMMAELSYEYDIVTHNPTAEEQKVLNKIKFSEQYEYHYKVDEQFVYYAKEELENQRPQSAFSADGERLEEYEPVSGELPVGAVLGSNQEVDGPVIEYPNPWARALRTIHPYSIYSDRSVKIVAQKELAELQGEEGLAFLGKTDHFEAYLNEWKSIDELQQDKPGEVALSNRKYNSYIEYYGIASGIVFMGFFLGIAFLAMMASCLMFKILSGASQDINRYQMLRKIGVRPSLLSKSAYKELFLVFLFPAILGIVHVLVGMNIFSFILIDPYFRVWLPIILFIAIYAAYYFITVQLYKGIVLPHKE
ncbi:FtsX-like permease family protein [Paenibacillus sp. J2TS4]|uniref:FtsX-like permease family protein n=1 Tax=Paenibacillus sp. J2TS4 TaxID=2807194 RepID=UPI001B1F27F6|nr:ABC transporter permease [Paenibacillus sp. J2TS4]GIP34202.1 ABC transporter permease [Paenibacillus sp. J2TS4]